MDKVRKLTNTRERLQKELQNKRQKIKSLKSEIKDLNKKIDKKESRIQSLKSKIDDLKGYKSKYERWIEGKLEIETEKKNAPWLKEQIHNEYPDAKIKPYDFSAQVTSEEEAKRIVKRGPDRHDGLRAERVGLRELFLPLRQPLQAEVRGERRDRPGHRRKARLQPLGL